MKCILVFLVKLLIALGLYEAYILTYLSDVHMNEVTHMAYKWHLRGKLGFGTYMAIAFSCHMMLMMQLMTPLHLSC